MKEQTINKVNICVRIRPNTRKKLDLIAVKKERKTTELIREVLENYVNQFDINLTVDKIL